MEKMNKSLQIIMMPTLQILKNDSNLLEKKGTLRREDKVMNEIITDFFASLVERIH